VLRPSSERPRPSVVRPVSASRGRRNANPGRATADGQRGVCRLSLVLRPGGWSVLVRGSPFSSSAARPSFVAWPSAVHTCLSAPTRTRGVRQTDDGLGTKYTERHLMREAFASCERRPAAGSTCGTSTCRSSAAPLCTRARSPEMKTGVGKTLVATFPPPERPRGPTVCARPDVKSVSAHAPVGGVWSRRGAAAGNGVAGARTRTGVQHPAVTVSVSRRMSTCRRVAATHGGCPAHERARLKRFAGDCPTTFNVLRGVADALVSSRSHRGARTQDRRPTPRGHLCRETFSH
jgi:hypothetical protein